MPASGRITFDWVPPGEYVFALPLQDLDRLGRVAWRETEVFRVGPGDDVVVRSLR